MNIQCAHDELLELHKIQGNPKNPNKHPETQIKRLAKLIEYQGQRHPIIISKRSGFVVVGHGRLDAIKMLGWEKAAVNYQDFENEAQEYAFVVSDNAIAEWAELDLSAINIEMLDFGPDFDVEHLGLKDFTIELPIELAPGDPDEIPEAMHDPKVVRGEVYVLGKHRLFCGDATSSESWDKIKSDHPTVVFTSPPYGVGSGAKLRDIYVKGGHTSLSLYNEHDDAIENWPQLMNDWTAMAISHGDSVICNVQMLAANKRHLIEWMSKFSPFMVDIAIWDKSHGPPQMQKNILTNVFEFLFVLSNEEGASRTIPLAKFHGNIGNVVRVGSAKNNEFASIHKATMPIELVDWALSLSHDAKHVIDPFGGTGTTMIAAEKVGISAGLIELDPVYCGLILDRWQKFTGKKAHREDGKLWDEIKAGET